MNIIGYLLSLVIVGLVIGAVGRLIIPGPNPIGLWATFAVGLAGAILGGAIGALIGLGAVSIVIEVAISAGLVYVVSGHRRHGRALSSGARRWL
jgi:uncharacterized membrane protein YeaQ/YmgE (transglycosylase-associated protein family)